MKIRFAADGTWTAEIGTGEKARTAAGRVSRHGDRLVLDGRIAAQGQQGPEDVHYALHAKGDRMWGVVPMEFKDRTATAMMELRAVPEPAASVPTEQILQR
jgi:hypothetical protein